MEQNYTTEEVLRDSKSIGLSVDCRCKHCGEPIPSFRQSLGRNSSGFCCLGCERVYSILHERGLNLYYDLKKKGTFLRQSIPASDASREREFEYLDDVQFQKLYVQQSRMTFYLEGIHCAACIWLLEKLPEFVEGIQSVRIDLSQSTATVQVATARFSLVAEEFQRLGYRPHPVRHGEAEELQKRENRKMLIRVAIAGTSTGNIMLLAVAVYGGATGIWADRFNWISFLLFLPVVLYSALPFYKNAWVSLKTRTISIDVPIVLAIVVGTLASVRNLITQAPHVYFDSLAALVFLLLASRYVLKRAQQNALQSSKLLHFLAPSTVRKVANASFAESSKESSNTTSNVSIDFIKTGDHVEVWAGESVPVDGLIVNGTSDVNCALLTGESRPISMTKGMMIHAGAVNLESPLVIEVSASGYSTRLGQILQSVEDSLMKRAPIVDITDKIAKWFVLGVMLLAIGVFAYTFKMYDLQEAINRALAIVIVTCPCALALATPLTMTVSIGRAAKNGILIKGADVIERLSKVKTVYLDKTGTVTFGILKVLEFRKTPLGQKFSDFDLLSRIYLLEARSMHPIARALYQYTHEKISHEVDEIRKIGSVRDFKEVMGTGVSGYVLDQFFEVRKMNLDDTKDLNAATWIGLYSDGKLLAQVALGDEIRLDAKDAMKHMQALGKTVAILSGDFAAIVEKTAQALGIHDSNVYSQTTPEEKSMIVQRDAASMMVGDGANDALALTTAHVGIAVHGGVEVSMRAADVYISRQGIRPLVEVLTLADETMKVIRRNLVFSLMYNGVGGGLAIAGLVNPLFAAIVMPTSALTVFLSAQLGTKKLRTMWIGK